MRGKERSNSVIRLIYDGDKNLTRRDKALQTQENLLAEKESRLDQKEEHLYDVEIELERKAEELRKWEMRLADKDVELRLWEQDLKALESVRERARRGWKALLGF